jgi:hypothetical protein
VSLGFSLTAKSRDNPVGASQTLTHYRTSDYTTAPVSLLALDGASAGTDRAGRFSALGGTWNAGVFTVGPSNFTFSRPADTSDASLTGPYESLYVGVGLTDADGVALTGADMKLNDVACTVNCTHVKLSASSSRMRFGRLYLPNVYGSEKLNLTFPIEAQYWSGSAWTRNTLDSCTSIDLAAGAQLANRSGNLATGPSTFGPPALYFGTTASTTGVLSSGIRMVTLAKPAPVATGYVDVGLRLGTGAGNAEVLCTGATWTSPTPASATGLGLAYLRGPWCSSSSGYDRDPSGRLTLGVTRSKFIFNRESY